MNVDPYDSDVACAGPNAPPCDQIDDLIKLLVTIRHRWGNSSNGDARMTAKQRELAEKHGTPAEFEANVWTAYAHCFITFDEARDGIAKYKAEWE